MKERKNHKTAKKSLNFIVLIRNGHLLSYNHPFRIA